MCAAASVHDHLHVLQVKEVSSVRSRSSRGGDSSGAGRGGGRVKDRGIHGEEGGRGGRNSGGGGGGSGGRELRAGSGSGAAFASVRWSSDIVLPGVIGALVRICKARICTGIETKKIRKIFGIVSVSIFLAVAEKWLGVGFVAGSIKVVFVFIVSRNHGAIQLAVGQESCARLSGCHRD